MAKQQHGTASLDAKQMLEFAAAVIRQLPRDLEPSIAQRWIENQGDLQSALRNALTLNQEIPAASAPKSKKARPEPTTTSFLVSVDFGRTVEEAVKAGKYDWVNEHITQQNFPNDQGQGKVETSMELVHFGRDMRSDKVVAELDKLGLRPATLMELLAFGAANPELQRQFPIFALGSVWTHPVGDCLVPCLFGGGDGRRLGLRWFDVEWGERCRFLGVRK